MDRREASDAWAQDVRAQVTTIQCLNEKIGIFQWDLKVKNA
jgi:hypothetical protein